MGVWECYFIGVDIFAQVRTEKRNYTRENEAEKLHAVVKISKFLSKIYVEILF